MIMPSTGFSHGVVHFWHMCQKIFVPISLCVSEVDKYLLTHVPRSSFLFERHLSEKMPPYGFNAPEKVLTHVCQHFFGLFLCVRNFDTQKQATKKKLSSGTLTLSPSLTFYFLCLSPSAGCLRRCHIPTHPSHLPPPLMSLPMSFTSTFL